MGSQADPFEEVFADPEVDLVVVASPSHLHGQHAIAALEAGKHVVTDKPAARDLAEFDRMAAAAHRARRTLSVFHNRRWDGDFESLSLTWALVPGAYSNGNGDGRRLQVMCSQLIVTLCRHVCHLKA